MEAAADAPGLVHADLPVHGSDDGRHDGAVHALGHGGGGLPNLLVERPREQHCRGRAAAMTAEVAAGTRPHPLAWWSCVTPSRSGVPETSARRRTTPRPRAHPRTGELRPPRRGVPAARGRAVLRQRRRAQVRGAGHQVRVTLCECVTQQRHHLLARQSLSPVAARSGIGDLDHDACSCHITGDGHSPRAHIRHGT